MSEQPKEDKIILDGKEISNQILNEKRNDPKVKIIEVSKNVYKTLSKLNG